MTNVIKFVAGLAIVVMASFNAKAEELSKHELMAYIMICEQYCVTNTAAAAGRFPEKYPYMDWFSPEVSEHKTRWVNEARYQSLYFSTKYTNMVNAFYVIQNKEENQLANKLTNLLRNFDDATYLLFARQWCWKSGFNCPPRYYNTMGLKTWGIHKQLEKYSKNDSISINPTKRRNAKMLMEAMDRYDFTYDHIAEAMVERDYLILQ